MTANIRRAGAGVDAAAQLEESSTQYLTFMLQGELFALGILAVKEIIEYGSLTVVPMMPRCIRGVINLRGAVVPVLDLCARFGRPSSPITKKTCIVIVEVPGQADEEPQDIGVIVDAVNAVVEIPAGEIEPAPSFGTRLRTSFVEGMGKVNGRFVIILRVTQVMSVEDLAALSGPAGEAEHPPGPWSAEST
jgi:purine-binding chemotaxis protein CheW